MSKSVKMFTLLDGKPSEIGQCHAGQARILCKKGIAEWKDGKLWLLPPPPKESHVHVTIPAEAPVEDILAEISKALNKRDTYRDVSPGGQGALVTRHEFKSTPEYLEAILREAGVDTSEWDAKGWYTLSPTPEYKEVSVASLPSFISEYRRRLGHGHEVCSYDDPRVRTIGFLDYTAREFVTIPITAVKERGFCQTDADALGVSLENLRAMICTAEGRSILFGAGDADVSWSGWSDTPLEDIDWGEMPPDVSALYNPDIPISLDRIAPPVRFEIKDGESYAECRTRVQEERRAAFKFSLAPIPGWTFFAVAGTHDVIPVLKDGKPHPTSPTDVPVYGLYKRVQGRLFRVWVQGCDAGWDESILQEDCTYKLSVSHTLEGQPAHEHVEETLRLVGVRLEELSADKETSHEVGPGWTKFFTFEDCPPVF